VEQENKNQISGKKKSDNFEKKKTNLYENIKLSFDFTKKCLVGFFF